MAGCKTTPPVNSATSLSDTPEGQRLFYTLPEQGTTFEEAMAALEKHFVPKVNGLACRHTFSMLWL